MKTIRVNLANNPYRIYIQQGLTSQIPTLIKKLGIGDLGLILTSPNIYAAHKKLIKKTFSAQNYKTIMLPDGEKAKSKDCLFAVINEILKHQVWNKRIFLVCLGGGTIGDVGGFAASIYKRGIPFVQIPTTLLAQIDASIGGKTAIDLKEAKNILGTFYQPKAVFIDPVFLTTLSGREIKQGLAEAIKYGAIMDKVFFDFLKTNHENILSLNAPDIMRIISTCATIKAKIVATDEKEKKGLRTILNFGHTLAHAMETSLNYHRLSHGEAVAIGMIYAARLSSWMGKCAPSAALEIENTVKLFGLPVSIKVNFLTICEALVYDKKFSAGNVRMVLLEKIGKVLVEANIPLATIKKSLKLFFRNQPFPRHL